MNSRYLQLMVGVLLFIGLSASAAVRYVNLNNPSPASPYTNWLSAATTIQDAIDVSTNGDLILVTNGVYSTGGRPAPNFVESRVAINKPVTVQSVNGPASTFIQGYQLPGTTNGVGAIRCAYLTNGATLVGFTLTKGATRHFGDFADDEMDRCGGGAWCETNSAVLSNCVIVKCASYRGAGTRSGKLVFCMITNCVADTAGGGAAYATLVNCSIVRNRSGYWAGGAFICNSTNCLFAINVAPYGGAGWMGTMNQCTVCNNHADYGGGTHSTVVCNSILYYNRSDTGGSNWITGDLGGALTNCCTLPLPAGPGNFTNPPSFVDQFNLFWLNGDSPCINAGNNAFNHTSRDLEGRTRTVAGTVDVGAYEYQDPNLMSFMYYLWWYYLPTDGSGDYVDTDADGMNNWQEWWADTMPNNSSSKVEIGGIGLLETGNAVIWSSRPTRTYWIERATNSLNFQPIAFGIPGQSGSTTFLDTTAPFDGNVLYRIGVE